MEKQNLIYTNVCRYCGRVYKSNRSTSKYCAKQHNSLYALNGPMIKPMVMEDGTVRNYDVFLEEIYEHYETNNPDGWGMGYYAKTIRSSFGYEGPLPKGEELLVVGSYVIERIAKNILTNRDLFFVKPFTSLTLKERLSKVIVAAADG